MPLTAKLLFSGIGALLVSYAIAAWCVIRLLDRNDKWPIAISATVGIIGVLLLVASAVTYLIH